MITGCRMICEQTVYTKVALSLSEKNVDVSAVECVMETFSNTTIPDPFEGINTAYLREAEHMNYIVSLINA